MGIYWNLFATTNEIFFNLQFIGYLVVKEMTERYCKHGPNHYQDVSNYLNMDGCRITLDLTKQMMVKEVANSKLDLRITYWLPITSFLLLLSIFMFVLMYRRKSRVTSPGSQSSSASLQREDSFSG